MLSDWLIKASDQFQLVASPDFVLLFHLIIIVQARYV